MQGSTAPKHSYGLPTLPQIVAHLCSMMQTIENACGQPGNVAWLSGGHPDKKSLCQGLQSLLLLPGFAFALDCTTCGEKNERVHLQASMPDGQSKGLL